MRVFIVVAILMFELLSEAFTQAPDTLWTKWYGGLETDRTKNICETSDGGFISCGQSNSFTKIYQTWLIRMNSEGDTLWTRILGDSVRPESFTSMEETEDGGLIACGGYFGLDTKYHTYLMKLNSGGDVEWKKIIGLTNNSDMGIRALQTNDNGYIILARQSGTGAGFWLYKTDLEGNLTDSAKYDWINSDVPEDMAISDDGGYVVSGISNSFGTSTGWDDMFLFKVNSSLDSLWMKLYANKDSLGSRLESVMKTRDGGYLLVGAQEEFPDAQNAHDYLVVKTDANGNDEWIRLYGSPRHESGFHSIELANHDFILTGAGKSKTGFGGVDAYVIRIKSNGDTLWTKYYGSPGFDELTKIIPVKSGGYILAGISYNFSVDPNKSDLYFIRIKSDETGAPDFNYNIEATTINPNPFSQATVIRWQSEVAGNVKLDIYSSLGDKIESLVDEWQETGEHSALFDVGAIHELPLQSGMYFYTLRIGDRIISGKLILIN